jgi:hypothetical protein
VRIVKKNDSSFYPINPIHPKNPSSDNIRVPTHPINPGSDNVRYDVTYATNGVRSGQLKIDIFFILQILQIP